MTASNNDKKLSVLRSLLDRYYRGETSVADEALLARMLTEPEAGGPEFAADRMLFAGTVSMAPVDGDAAVPAELGRQLQAMTSRHFASRALGRIPRWMRVAACGAAAACMAGLVFMTARIDSADSRLAQHAPVETVAEIEVHRASVGVAATLPVARNGAGSAVGGSDSDNGKVLPAAVKPGARGVAVSRHRVVADASAAPAGHDELLASADPDETTAGIDPMTAAAMSEAAVRVLAQTMAAAGTPMAQTSATIDGVNQTINKIKINIK